MAITLESVTNPGATPITFNSASSIELANDYFKLAVPNLTTRQLLTVMTVAMIHALPSPDYTNNHAGLMQDAQVYTGAIPQFNWVVAMAALAWTAGKGNDATLSNDIEALLAEGRDLEGKSEEEQWRAITLLFAQLGFNPPLVPCWVAREVYGPFNPKWLIFRSWLMGDAPNWLRSLYISKGQGFARWISDKPRIKRVVRYFMDKVVG